MAWYDFWRRTSTAAPFCLPTPFTDELDCPALAVYVRDAEADPSRWRAGDATYSYHGPNRAYVSRGTYSVTVDSFSYDRNAPSNRLFERLAVAVAKGNVCRTPA